MSLLKKAFKGIKKVVKRAAPLASMIPGPIGAIGKAATVFGGIGGGFGGGGTTQMSMLPALPGVIGSVGRVALPGIGRAVGGAVTAVGRRVSKRGLTVLSKKAIKQAGYFVVGGLIYDAAGNLIGETAKRRMNPLNHRALNRAIRRVCSAKSISKKIEKLTGSGTRRRSGAACKPSRKRC